MDTMQPTSASEFRLGLDWTSVARQVLRSRRLDLLEEETLTPEGEIPCQFSARGHELAQVLLAAELDHPHDAVGSFEGRVEVFDLCTIPPGIDGRCCVPSRRPGAVW